MSRSKLFIVLAAILAAAFAVFIPHLKARVVSTGTPVPKPLLQSSLFPVPQHAGACIDQVAVDPGSQAALFDVETPRAGPALRFTIRGAAYQQVYEIPSGYVSGQVTVPFDGPRRSLLARVCIRNLGGGEVQLRGTNEPRTLSRPRMTINRAAAAGEFSLAFRSANGQSTFALVGTIARRISAFRPIWVQPWLVIALLVVVFSGAFVVPLVALWRSLSLDEQ
jgi:hypothetical protein